MSVPMGSQAIDSDGPSTESSLDVGDGGGLDQYIGSAVSGILPARAKLRREFPA
jgi:hypothetical protein